MNVPRLAVSALALSLVAAAPDPLGDASTKLMTAGRIPGAVILVADRDRVTALRTFGVKNVESKLPVDAHTRFEIGSITKQFTAAAILQLAERGKLKLTDTLGMYVPEYAAAKDVTLEQMLGQVSGIPDYTNAAGFAALISTSNGAATIQTRGDVSGVLALVRDKPLAFAPGSRWAYSNTNYYLLGRIVEIASGTSWNDYVRKNLFAPAGMTESGFMEDEPSMTDVATGYTTRANALLPTSTFNGWAGGAGAIVSTATDLRNWDVALLRGKIVSAASLARMLQPGAFPAGSNAHYGFGWMIDSFDGQRREWHNGGTLGFSAANHVYPDLGQTIIVLENNGEASADAIANAVFEALHPELARAAEKPAQGEDPAITALAKRIYDGLVNGPLDRSVLSDQMNALLTPAVLAQMAPQVKAFGTPQTWTFAGNPAPGAYVYRVRCDTGQILNVFMAIGADGKVTGYRLTP